jgi:hypothetical protein
VPAPLLHAMLTHPDFHNVAAAQLAINGKVEQRPVAQTPFLIEPEPDGPDQLRLESAFRADHVSGFHGRLFRIVGSNSECPIVSSSWPGLAIKRIHCSSSGKGGA